MKLPILLALLTLPASAVVSIDWVTIGNAGNTAQSAANRMHSDSGGDGFGAVSHEYSISRNETTISQYVTFLNAVAATDSYGLYNSKMATNSNIAGISRNGSSGNFIYSVIGSGNRPVTYASWFDAARFANWLHNGQQTGPGAELTAEHGAYTLNGATSGIFTMNVSATVWIPSENEWFKAAYYDPTHMSGAGGYWLYGNQSDSMASNTIGAFGASNHYDGDYAVSQQASYISGQNYLTDVGNYGINSQSYYNINDMSGNALEWNDTIIHNQARALRGGSWANDEFGLRSSYSDVGDPYLDEFFYTGFRLASVPEPYATALTLLSATPLLRRRRPKERRNPSGHCA